MGILMDVKLGLLLLFAMGVAFPPCEGEASPEISPLDLDSVVLPSSIPIWLELLWHVASASAPPKTSKSLADQIEPLSSRLQFRIKNAKSSQQVPCGNGHALRWNFRSD
jgi:hypothetical protein